MSKLRLMASAIFAAAVVACLAISATGQTGGSLANVSGGGSAARWDVTAPNAGGTLTINFPDGRSIRKTFSAGGSPSIAIGDKYFEDPPDGVYAYELQLASAPSDAAIKARGKDNDPESERAGRKRSAVPAMTQSGAFAVANGSIVVAGGLEPEQKRPEKASTGPAAAPATRTLASPNMLERIRNNHRAFFKPDFVIADDLVVQGSACVGLDCVNNEPFQFDTIRMKENNTRILFLDTSTSAGFPTNDWIIRANGPNSGDASFLGIVDHGNAGTGAETGTIIAQFDAGATANSLRVSSTGRVGLKTATPVLALHINESDTPDIRLEQNNSGGFAAQTWDIAGNEANFFVRDVTGGSLLPFRIRPGAPTSSLDIAASGNVGISTASPAVNLDVRGSNSKIQIGTETALFLGPSQTGFGISNGTEKFLSVVQTGGGFFGTISNHPLGLVANNNTRVTISGSGAVQFNTYGAGTLVTDASGNITASSDERLKKNIRPFTRGLHNVLGLKPILYGYTTESGLDQTRNDYVGFSAQNVRDNVPEAVGEDTRGMLTLSDRPIIVALVNSIKEQQKEINELKRQIQKLQASRRSRR